MKTCCGVCNQHLSVCVCVCVCVGCTSHPCRPYSGPWKAEHNRLREKTKQSDLQVATADSGRPLHADAGLLAAIASTRTAELGPPAPQVCALQQTRDRSLSFCPMPGTMHLPRVLGHMGVM
jgi:hypothetical protein